MSVADIKSNIEKLKRDYTDPADKEVLDEWEKRLATTLTRQRYLELDQTKELVAYLKKRLRDIRIKLSSDSNMDIISVKSYHWLASEIKELLALLVINPEKEMRLLENEIAESLGN